MTHDNSTRSSARAECEKNGNPDRLASRVYIHSVAGDLYADTTRQKLVDFAACRLHPVHELVARADMADIILVVARPDGDPFLQAVWQDPIYQEHAGISIGYCEHANAATILPGIYTGAAAKWLCKGWAASGPYVGKMRPSKLSDAGRSEEIKYLYSFVGSAYTHPIRGQLLLLGDERALLRDSGSLKRTYGGAMGIPPEIRTRWQVDYDWAIAASSFVLCPRGRCCAAIRLYEAMRAGRAPVIISDDWLLPSGPKWDSFALRVPEAAVNEIPQLLRDHESEATERGRLAREAWEEWFSDDVIFDRIVELALDVQQHRSDTPINRLWRRRILFSEQHIRDLSRVLRHTIRAQLRIGLKA